MTWTTSNGAEISEAILSQLEQKLGVTLSILPKSFSRVLAKVLAGVFVLIYKYAGFTFLQMFVKTASFSPTTVNGVTLTPLIEHGRLIGVTDPTAATQAELLIEITVENQSGSLIAGAQLIGPSNGVTYVTLSSVFLDAATKQVQVRAVNDEANGGGAGSIGNLDDGALLSFANPVGNVARTASVVSTTVTGADAETEAAYRQRVIDRFQKRPQGGAYADYESWAEEVAGIVNAYPYAGAPGVVNVYVEATVESSGSEDGIPTGGQLAAVEASIQADDAGLASRRPIGALVQVFPISRTVFTVEVTGLAAEDLVAANAEIETSLETWFASRGPYIEGLSVPPRRDRITLGAVGGVVSDAVEAVSGEFATVILRQNGAPIEYYELGEGEKTKFGGLV